MRTIERIEFRDMGGNHVAVATGYCPIYKTRIFMQRDEGDKHLCYPDPRGAIGRNSAYFLDPQDYGMRGKDFKICFECGNESGTYQQALKMAKRRWKSTTFLREGVTNEPT